MLSALRKNRFLLMFICFLLTLSYFLIEQRQRRSETTHSQIVSNTVTPELIERIDQLKRRLREVEFSNNERSREIISLKQQLKRALPKNETDAASSLTLPSIFSSLPHLIAHPEGLIPALRVSKDRRQVTLAFGIPTVRREHKSYLLPTIESMLQGLSDEDKDDVIIIVFIADKSLDFAEEVARKITKKFPEAVHSGLLEIIAPPATFYPDMNNLRLTFNDPLERVQWRTKQNLDYSFLMMYAQNKARFYVQMEDDIIASPSYAATIKTFALQQDTMNWLMLEFSALGFIGKLFRSSDLGILVEFFVMFHMDKPIDWLLDHVLWVKVCNPEKDLKHCTTEKSKLRVKFKPSLFQHIGQESSLKGKRQALIDKDFKQQPLFQAHLNPKAIVKSTFEVYQQFTPEKAYLGQGFFWGLTPHTGEVMRFCFLDPVELERFKFQTGNIEHPGDVLQNATVEVLTAESKSLRDKIKKSAFSEALSSNDVSALETKVRDEYPLRDYIQIGAFEKGGIAEGRVPAKIGRIAEVRIRVIRHKDENWIILSEIHLVKRKKK